MLFGSIFVISPDTVPALIASGVVALVVVAVLTRVLLLTSLSPDLARARGVNVRIVGIAYLAALAVSVSLAAVAIGAVLSTALLIGPSATALRITKSPGRAMAASALTGLAATWLGIVLAYDSYYWPPHGHGWPVSFFVVALVLVGYLLTYVRRPRRRRAALSARGGRMFSGLMMNTWITASIVAVIAGMIGFFAVLRGQTFAAHAIPNGAFAGAAGRQPARHQRHLGAGGLRDRRRPRHRRARLRAAGPQGTQRRGDRARRSSSCSASARCSSA